MKYFSLSIFIIFLLLGNNFSNGQDSTVTLIGPGVKYYSVKKPDPQNIRIIEIDLTNPNIKLETVLARDRMGIGFERTSSMAHRNSYSGHIVLGAINGDFFGISEPNNPYDFLSNSMIKNHEYVTGKQNFRTSFAYTDNGKPLMNIFNFSGSVKTKNDSSFNIANMNTIRGTNNLILYNKYIADSTRTNVWGTEVRLAPIVDYRINQPMKFVVLEKVTNVGNMSINNNYILSGHGTAQAYLNNNVNVNDTITLTLGTAINKVGLLSLIGGGPRLVSNGIKPASFVGAEGFDASFTDAQHPRTAVGFNQDSTKLYFVTVDGRQPLISVGMTLSQLADYMISIGCKQALNLDGGGSTTMVTRGNVVNSPSDPGGERSCGNALMAVLYAQDSEIMGSLNLSPESIIIDSTQTKKITANGVDIWGYPIDISISNIDWQLIGISGSIDSLGFFRPINSGIGKIIGRFGTYTDTIDVSVLANRIPIWTYSAAGNNLPNWFSPTASTERGMAYGNVNNRHRIYVVNRPNITILDADSGDEVGILNTTSISGGTYPINDIEVSDDGVIFAANLTTNSSSNHFRIYTYNSDTSNAINIIDFAGSGRLGDKFSVVGKTIDNSAVIYAAAAGSNIVYKWTMSNGSFNQTPQTIALNGLSNSGTNTSVYPKGLGDANIFINGNSMRPQEYTSSGTLVGTAPNIAVDSRSSAMKYINGEKKYLIVYQYGFPNENAAVLDVTNGLSNAALLETTLSLGTNANTIGASGDIAYRKYQDGLFLFYVLATNNGIGAYQLADLPTGIEDFTDILPKEYELSQNFPNPFNPSTRINYSLPKSGDVTLTVYNMLGQKVSELINENKQAGNYYQLFDGSNLSSGIYLYTIRVNDFVQTKKMILIK